MNLEQLASQNAVWNILFKLKDHHDITEIMINNSSKFFIEKKGTLIALDAKVESIHLERFIQDVLNFNKSELFYETFDGNLPDGSRINIISEKYSGQSPVVTIRKFLPQFKSFDGSPGIFGMTPKMTLFLKSLVHSRSNILISGSTNSGKTTFLNLLANEINPLNRVITIEDAREIQVANSNCVHLTYGGNRELKCRDLLKNSLRMRPDQIIIGEVRGAEAFDLLQAMNTGHDGSLATIHASSTKEALSRLESLFLFAGHDIPVNVVRRQVVDALDYVIHLKKDRNGERSLWAITELTGMEGDRILLQDVVSTQDGGMFFTGLVPSGFKTLQSFGLDSNFFEDA